MLLPRFDPPAFLDDLDDSQKAAWSQFISGEYDSQIAQYAGNHFYNPTVTDTTADVVTVDISWTGFPRNVQIGSPSDQARWESADGSRDLQDEYCEWSVTRDPSTGKVLRVTFTCEGPEYWSFLAAANPGRVLDLYRQHVSPDVAQQDLFTTSGQYRPRNKWNNSATNGAMHLVQGANTLGAEINIAIRSTIVRRINGTVLTDAQDLINCGRYGDPNRFSDPTIGAEVNALAQQDAAVTIANPVALYIRDLDTTGWSAPDGSDPRAYWSVTRGTPQHAVRAVYEVPSGRGFSAGDITINGSPIAFGGQIADFITIKVIGQACRIGQNVVPPVTQCEGFSGAPSAEAVPSVEDAIRQTFVRRHR